VLHFDVNKTLIMCDPVKGWDMSKMVNALLSESCYGTYEPLPSLLDPASKSKLAATWSPVPPLQPSSQPRAGLITYSDFLEEKLQLPKKEKDALKSTFVDAGQVGQVFHSAYQDLLQCLQLPSGVKLPWAPPAIQSGSYFMLPAFFRLLLNLRAQGRDFALVFRTFGTDLPEVAEELEAFCTGSHPLYPGVRMDGTTDCPDYRLHTDMAFGEFFRDAHGVQLTMRGPTGTCLPVQGWAEVWRALDGMLSAGHRALGLRDYYPFWREQGESDTSGKLLLLDPSRTDVHHIFFDDNVQWEKLHIIDARDVTTGDPIPFVDVIDHWVVKAEPLEAIRDPDYFIKAVELCEANLNTCAICRGPVV